ncbi:hypothetical protein MVEN_00699800 [Mycena venus]|uniref:Uncharacterized protein n=1 Tax=Mycena venus TaxID=2733690 RepID=A0A8H6YK41_9AGAR|nr:hypothetical protein MVEN_00699800 [Mycena venus]
MSFTLSSSEGISSTPPIPAHLSASDTHVNAHILSSGTTTLCSQVRCRRSSASPCLHRGHAHPLCPYLFPALASRPPWIQQILLGLHIASLMHSTSTAGLHPHMPATSAVASPRAPCPVRARHATGTYLTTFLSLCLSRPTTPAALLSLALALLCRPSCRAYVNAAMKRPCLPALALPLPHREHSTFIFVLVAFHATGTLTLAPALVSSP